MSLTKVSYSMIAGSPLNVKDYGALSNGVADDSTAIQAAIDAAFAAGGNIVVIPGDTRIGTTITVKSSVVLDCQWNNITPLTDINMFTIKPGGQIRYARCNLEGLTYTRTVAKLVPDGNIQGDRFIPWISGLAIKFAANTITDGVGVEIDSDTYYVQLMSAENISVRYGGKGIYLHGTGTGGLDYANGNVFNGVGIMDSYYSFYLNGFSNGNVFDGVVIERNTRGNIYCAGSQNNWSGVAWDQVDIEVSGTGNNFGTIQTTQYGANITDTGEDNRSYSRSVTQFNNISTNSLNDLRHGLYEPGTVAFRDFFLGSKSNLWTQTLTGSASVAYGNAVYGASSPQPQWLPYLSTVLSGAVGDSVLLNFNGAKIVSLQQKPILHATNFTTISDARALWRVGLYSDANNLIYATQDFNLYGDDDIRLVVKNGGATTTQVISTSAFNRVTFMTFVMSTTSIQLRIGQYNNASTSDSGRVGRGIWAVQTLLDAGSTTVTTNIPTTSYFEPYIYVYNNNASAGSVQFFDYQLIASRKAII